MAVGAAPIRVGIGGWTFPPWRGAFYPLGLKHADELAYAAGRLTSIEINATFHGTQPRTSFEAWRAQVPPGFVFSVKAPRAATWRRDLGEAMPAIARFLASGVTALAPGLGAILWQLPPNRAFDPGRIEAFLALLPPAHAGVALRHALEAAHPSFADPRFAEQLRRHGVAWASIDADGHPPADTSTANFLYARLKRSSERYRDGYAPARLAALHAQFEAAARAGQECFVYFIAGDKVRAPAAALALLRRLGRDATPPRPGRRQKVSPADQR